jgi:AcrR family transcriptional regulator
VIPEPPIPRRAGRPPRLTIDQVIATGISIVDADGLEALSMPKLAKQLGVGTMTLYGYVKDKKDLLDRVAAKLIDEVTIPETGSGVQRLGDYFRSLRQSALQHPAMAPLLSRGRRGRVGIPPVFDHLETLLAALERDGTDRETAVRAFYACHAYTIGFVIWEIPRRLDQPPEHYSDRWAELLEGLEPSEYPTLTGPAAPHLPTIASDAQFEWGLEALLSSTGAGV